MDKDTNSGLKGCLIIFFVVGIILSYCFQCSYDSFEDWYYAEMDVIGIGEYPDM